MQIKSETFRTLLEKAIEKCGSKSALGRQIGSISRSAPNAVVNFWLRRSEQGRWINIKPVTLRKLNRILQNE